MRVYQTTCRLLLACVTFAMLPPVSLQAQSLPFLDDFNDGSIVDGSPGTWSPGGSPGGTWDASTGDLVVSHTQLASRSIDELSGLTDVSIETQLNFSQLSGNRDSVVLFTRSAEGSFYYGEITSDGALAYGVSDRGNITNWSLISTSLDPVNEDVLLRFDVIGNNISLFAWQSGAEMPTTPQLRRTNGTVSAGGNVGLAINANINGGNSPASATFRLFQVVPEPSSLVLFLVGIVGTVRIARSAKRKPSQVLLP